MSAHPSELALERHLADPAASALGAHLQGCPRCAARVEEMRREGDAFLRYVLPATVEKVEEAAARAGRRLSWFPVLAPVTAAAAAAALLLLAQPAGDPWTGVKGEHGLGLSVFLNGEGGARVAREGEQVAASSALRFRVQPAAPCHLWVLSVDAAGQVSRLYPTEGDGGALVATRFEVPGGAVLDGKPGPERVFAICTPSPTYHAAVERLVQVEMARGEQAVRGTRAIRGLPAGTAQASVLLEKR
jgi:hypothetical protein